MTEHRPAEAACFCGRTQMTQINAKPPRALLWRLVKVLFAAAGLLVCYRPLAHYRNSGASCSCCQIASTTKSAFAPVAYKGRCAAASQ